jgi:hypothetical protein
MNFYPDFWLYLARVRAAVDSHIDVTFKPRGVKDRQNFLPKTQGEGWDAQATDNDHDKWRFETVGFFSGSILRVNAMHHCKSLFLR